MRAVTEAVTMKRLLSIKDTVKEFGGTPWLWRSLIWGREIPFVQIGRKHYLDRRDLDEFIGKSKRTA